MKIEELEIGKIYIYRNTEPLVFKHYPSSSCFGLSSFKFETIEAKPKAIYLDHQAVNNSITEVKAEKPEVPNFRPDHYTSLPFKLDKVQETIAQNCFKATTDEADAYSFAECQVAAYVKKRKPYWIELMLILILFGLLRRTLEKKKKKNEKYQ